MKIQHCGRSICLKSRPGSDQGSLEARQRNKRRQGQVVYFELEIVERK